MKDSQSVVERGQLIGWACKFCKAYNDILNAHCWSCYCYKPSWLSEVTQHIIEVKRGVFLARGFEDMTNQEELFSKFYNHEKVAVKDMDIMQLREHREQLQQIAFEAKARLVAADDELREKTAKSKTAKEWLTSVNQDAAGSDAINAVQVRRKRMNKIEKLRADLTGKIDEDTLNEMIRNLEKKATEKDLKTITFKKAPSTEPEIGIVQVPVSNEEERKPADLSGLVFAKKG